MMCVELTTGDIIELAVSSVIVAAWCVHIIVKVQSLEDELKRLKEKNN